MKIVYFLLIISVLISCSSRNTRVQHSIKTYIQENSAYPESYESIKFDSIRFFKNDKANTGRLQRSYSFYVIHKYRLMDEGERQVFVDVFIFDSTEKIIKQYPKREDDDMETIYDPGAVIDSAASRVDSAIEQATIDSIYLLSPFTVETIYSKLWYAYGPDGKRQKGRFTATFTTFKNNFMSNEKYARRIYLALKKVYGRNGDLEDSSFQFDMSEEAFYNRRSHSIY